MSFPNHPTSDIENVFSYNSPDYTPTSPEYSLASSRNTSFDSSNTSYSLVLIVSPTLSLFHDDSYMKVMHAYDTIMPPQGLIPPPIIVPPSPMLSPIFNPQKFFAAIRQLFAAALEAQAVNMANANNTNRNPKPREAPVVRKLFPHSNCTEDCKVKFATRTLTEEALSWWNSFAQPIGIEEAYKITWVEFKKLWIKKYCPRTEIQKMEDEFYHLTVKGNDLKTYV
uniref:Reverse transcriptase domain-containing protein n=1 Tax=Tanacetum cinerariifolium TaxID=118510 RepID=A0A6L2KJ96_TANCI|nr:reverse transcriptase domain-containing protein [Tanacetum cinerariifolium]